MSTKQLIITVAAIMLATVITRFLPFVIFGKSKKTPKFIDYLGKTLPFAAVALLVIYCFKGISFASLEGFLPLIIAGIITAVLHLWKGNTLLSIGAGTVIYMLLVQFVF